MEATGFSETGMYPNVRWAAGLQTPPPQLEFKNLYFVDSMKSVVLCDLPVCQNQPLKLADHYGILKNEILKEVSD
jgi:hypothetical protein